MLARVYPKHVERLPRCYGDAGVGELLLRGSDGGGLRSGLIPRARGVPPALPLGRLACPLFGRQRLLRLGRRGGLARGTRLAFPRGGDDAGRGEGGEDGGGVEVEVDGVVHGWLGAGARAGGSVFGKNGGK